MNDLTILFGHIQADELTLRHLEIIRTLNPGVPIVPLTFQADDSAGQALPGSFRATQLEPRFVGQNPWAAADCLIYAWYVHARTQQTAAHRYAYAEWDMLFRVPMRDFYAEVWDRDVACAECFFIDRHWSWNWFKEIYRLPKEIRKFAAGLSPFAGTFLSDRALDKITKQPIPLHVFCELRLGTLANAAGFEIARLPYDKCRNLTWKQELLYPVKSPVYHPVKSTDFKLP